MAQSRLTCRTDPAALVAIIIAARRAGDRELERAAKRELRDGHGIALRFVARPDRAGGAT